MNKSIYQTLGTDVSARLKRNLKDETIELDRIIRRHRLEKGLSGADLCRHAGDLDPKTLTAVEKGRIKNPSIKTLMSIARGLGVSVGDLFRQAEAELEKNLHQGTQKGSFCLEFPGQGVKIISFTPFTKEFFCGKLLIAPKRHVTETLLDHPQPLFVSPLIGRVEIQVQDRRVDLREGENLCFNGLLQHSFHNPLHRESVLWIVTAPSFL